MDRQAAIHRLRGCYLAQPTLFNEDLSLNLDGMRQHVRFLVDHGFRTGNATLLVNGAVGEFPHMSVEERKQSAQAVVEAAAGRLPVIVGGQSANVTEVIEIARHAQSIGAVAVQVSAPFYYDPTDDDIVEFFASIGQAAPELPIVAYPTPWKGIRFSVPLIDRLLEIPQMAGLKWNSPDSVEYQTVFVRFAKHLGIIDNRLMPVFNQLMGGIGIHVQPALFWPEWGVKVWDMLEAHKWEEVQVELDRVLLPFYHLYRASGRITGGEGHIDKVAMEYVGLPGGRNRPPTRPLPADFKERIFQYCRDVGVPRITA